MPTIAQLSRNIIRETPYIEEAIYKGIIHYGGLAKFLKPKIESELNKEVKLSAIIMALRRIGEDIKEQKLKETEVIKIKSEIIVRSDLVDITIINNKNNLLKLKKIYDISDPNSGDFLSITKGIYETTIIINKKYVPLIKELFGKKDFKFEISDLSAIILKIPEDSWQLVGVFNIIIHKLSWHNINIVEIVSTFTELIFIVYRKDAGKAFDVLLKEMD